MDFFEERYEKAFEEIKEDMEVANPDAIHLLSYLDLI